MACTFNQHLDSVSLASQILIGPVVSMIKGPPMASMSFLVLALSHGVHPSKRMLQDPTLLSGYKALAHAATEVTWLQALLKDLQVPSSCPVI